MHISLPSSASQASVLELQLSCILKPPSPSVSSFRETGERSSTTANMRANKLTKQIHLYLLLPMLPKTVFFRCEQEEEEVFRIQTNKSKQTHGTNHFIFHLLLPVLRNRQKPICLFIQMNRRRSSAYKVFHKKKQESKQTHKNKSLPSSVSHASKP